MGRTLEYPRDPRNTVNRKRQRGTFDLEPIHTIVNSAQVIHVSFSPEPADPFPAILPMIGVMGSFEHPSAGLDDVLECYLHGYVSSRIINLSRKSVADGGKGLPVCIAASKVDGIILAMTPNNHSYNYRSAILFGYATLVTETDEKLWAMELITNKVVPDRWENTRVPPNAAEMSSTQILRVQIESGSGKIRDGAPGDEQSDKDSVGDRVWAGYLPLVEQFLEPVPSAYNRVKEVPQHVVSFKENFNKEQHQYVESSLQMVKEDRQAS